MYCNRRNFVRDLISYISYFFAESTKFSSIRKPYTYTNVSYTTLRCTKINSVRKFANARVRTFYAYEIFCDYSSRACHKIPIGVSVVTNGSPALQACSFWSSLFDTGEDPQYQDLIVAGKKYGQLVCSPAPHRKNFSKDDFFRVKTVFEMKTCSKIQI